MANQSQFYSVVLPAPASNMPGTGSRDRTRSPPRAMGAWSSGDASLDHPFAALGVSPDKLDQLAGLPLHERTRIMKTMVDLSSQGKLRSVDGYVVGCVKKYAENSRSQQGSTPPRAAASAASSPTAGHPGSPPAMPYQNSEAAEPLGHQTVPAVPPPSFLTALGNSALDHSTFLDQFVNLLHDRHLPWIFGMDPTISTCVAWAFMLSCPFSTTNPHVVLDALMSQYHALLQAEQAIPRPIDTQARPRALIQILISGVTVPAAVAVCAAIIPRLRRGIDGVDLIVKPPIITHGVHAWSQVLARDCVEQFGSPEVVFECTPSFVRQDISAHAAEWKRENVKWLLLNVATHPTVTPPIALPKFAPSDLHGSNHHGFELLALADGLRAALGDENVAEAIMVPQPSNDFVSQIWGGNVEFLKPADWLPVRPVPSVFGVPSNMRIASAVPDDGTSTDPCNGQVRAQMNALPALQHDNGIRPHLLSKAAAKVLMAMGNHDDIDVGTINNLRVDTPGGGRLLPSRGWWLRWYCLQPEASARVYDAKYPCIGQIMIHNGRAVTEQLGRMPHAVTICGERRYCANCMDVFRHLDRQFVEASMADTLLAMAANCAGHWAGRPGPQPLMWGRPAGNMRNHQCKETCLGI